MIEGIKLPTFEVFLDDNLKIIFKNVEIIKLNGMNNKEFIVDNNKIFVSIDNFNKFIPEIQDISIKYYNKD